MKTETKTEIKDCLFMASMHLIMIVAFTLMLTSNAKATSIDSQLVLKQINTCTAISVHYLENGKYNGGDSDLLFMNLSIDEQKAKASKLIIDSEKAEITNIKGNCNINIHYKI